MIVSCPACNARYRINPDKIKGRGAKITCPRCGHKFVVYKDRPQASAPEAAAAPMRGTSAIGTRDFRRVGVTWRVKKAIGVTYSFHDLAALEKHIDAGRVEGRDVLSYDARTWVPIDSLEDLGAYFEDIWRKAERGEIGPAPSRTPTMDEEEEGPTTIMGHGHALMDDIRKAVAEATTPPPSPARSSDPWHTPVPVPKPSAGEFPGDDPTTFSRRSRQENADSLTPSTSDVRGHFPDQRRSPTPNTATASRTRTPGPAASAPPMQGTGTREPDTGDLDNTIVLVTAILAIVVVLVALGFGLWWTGFLRVGPGPQPGPANVPTQPAAAPAPSAPPAGGSAP